MTKKALSLVSIISILFAITVSPAIASVEFDGMTWYHSHTDSTYNISVNGEGQLVWIPKNDHQIIVRIPEVDLSDAGDEMVISYYWKSDGSANISGCDDCFNEATCTFNKDITCLSGTGDFRIGFFESDGDYITADGMGIDNEIFRGYVGYKFHTQPHVDLLPIRWSEESGEPHIAGGFYERDMVDDPRLISVNEVCDRISQFGGYAVPLDTWILWTMKLKRLSSTEVEMTMTFGDVTYTDIDTTDTTGVPQPQKIDVFVIDFANPNPFYYIKFGIVDPPPPPTPLTADFTGDCIVDACDLEVLSRDWLDSDKLITASQPDDGNLVLDYSFDGILNNPVPTGLTDDTSTYTAQIIVGTNAASEIKYASPNPTTGSGTSAQFINDLFGTGDADTFVIPNTGGLDFNDFNEFTIELFANPSSSGTGNTRRLFAESIYMYVHLATDDTLNASRKWGGGSWNENWTNLQEPNFPHDTWSHVATTWDADSEGDRFKLYINGELVASDVGSSDLTLGTAAGFAIGGYQRDSLTTGQPFCGSIDEFSIYDYALSHEEVLYLANDGPATLPVPLDSPANLYDDNIIDEKDFAKFALEWLDICQ
jgi:hypothetical protein